MSTSGDAPSSLVLGEPLSSAGYTGARYSDQRARRRYEQHAMMRQLDARGIEEVELVAVTAPPVSGTYARPPRCAGLDGREHWVKTTAQSGLMSELAGGRLAAMVGVGPGSTIVRAVTPTISLQLSPTPYDDQGVGSRHIPGCVNARQIQAVLDPTVSLSVDSRTWTAASVFQTWIAAVDPQVLIRLDDGAVFAIDFGACFDKLLRGPVGVITAKIPGAVLPSLFSWTDVDETLHRIMSLSDEEVFSAFSRMPEGGPWRALFQRRVSTADWLLRRRSGLPAALEKASWRMS